MTAFTRTYLIIISLLTNNLDIEGMTQQSDNYSRSLMKYTRHLTMVRRSEQFFSTLAELSIVFGMRASYSNLGKMGLRVLLSTSSRAF